MAGMVPRAVVLRRASDYELLLERHGTAGQAEFFLASRGQSLAPIHDVHRTLHEALTRMDAAVPSRWRRAAVLRQDLDRFLFEPEDIVIAVGQDGLVANLAKYLHGQPVIGVNPLPAQYDGVLVRSSAETACAVIARIDRGGSPDVEPRTMVQVSLDDGQTLAALNEIFLGHRSHQSARYRIRTHGAEERHSSSGVIVATGTGSTGWARSINLSRGNPLQLPAPCDRTIAYFVREPFPSVATGTRIAAGICAMGEEVEIVSEMNDGGLIFGDGIEADAISFDWGRRATLGVSARTLNLVAA